MIKIISLFLIGTVLTLILDFFLFVGLKINYLDYYEIGVYFNSFFIDNQSIVLFVLLTLFFGFIFVYPRRQKKAIFIYLAFLLLSLLPNIESVGLAFGKKLFYKSAQQVNTGTITQQVDVLYEGRKHLYILNDYDNKAIKILKR